MKRQQQILVLVWWVKQVTRTRSAQGTDTIYDDGNRLTWPAGKGTAWRSSFCSCCRDIDQGQRRNEERWRLEEVGSLGWQGRSGEINRYSVKDSLDRCIHIIEKRAADTESSQLYRRGKTMRNPQRTGWRKTPRWF